jgi:hypothetical protein
VPHGVARYHAGRDELGISPAIDFGHIRAKAEAYRDQHYERLDGYAANLDLPGAYESVAVALPYTQAAPQERILNSPGYAYSRHSSLSPLPVSRRNTSSRFPGRLKTV